MNSKLYYSTIDTPLGTMLASADEHLLYTLKFADRVPNLFGVQCLVPPIASIAEELEAYFNGKLFKFRTPLYLSGTDFQKLAWNALLQVPYGKTQSYTEQARAIGRAKAYRAVANANAANNIAIVMPCHRIINHSGGIGGYGGGIERKKWLLEHEALNTKID